MKKRTFTIYIETNAKAYYCDYKGKRYLSIPDESKNDFGARMLKMVREDRAKDREAGLIK